MDNRQEQIEQAKRLIATGISEELVEVLHQQFPELKESEDERIRKNCIHFLELQKAHHADTSEIDDCIAYLEKQNEQKPDFIVPKRIRPKFAVGDTVCRPMWSDHIIREIYIDCDDPVYICVNEEGTESHISFSEQDEWERKEQQPAEWSEEDEKKLSAILFSISRFGGEEVILQIRKKR